MSEQKMTSGLYTRSEEIPDERFRFFCAECGNPISGFPYLTTWHGWCACFDPWDFCVRRIGACDMPAIRRRGGGQLPLGLRLT